VPDPAPTRRPRLQSRVWRLWHSAWLLPALLCLGLLTWLSFLYIGLRARRRVWLLSAAGYVAGDVIVGTVGGSIGGGLAFALWTGGAAHALIVNRSWLRWRSSHIPWYLT
jgi:hypothetical protein